MPITRQRSVTPDAFLNTRLLALSSDARLTEVGLRLYADNYGREEASSRLLTVSIFPLDREMRDEDMDRILLELDQAGCIDLYDVAGVTYYQVRDWPAVQHPGADSRFPALPPKSHEPFMSASGESHGEGERGRGRERGNESEGERGLHEALPPSPFCARHPDGADTPCRACGTARMRRKVWDDKQLQSVRFEMDDDG